jgi:hypothetical protein
MDPNRPAMPLLRSKTMPRAHLFFIPVLLAAISGPTAAAPDEDKLGKAQGYPIGTARNWFFDESVRVGSFTAQGEHPAIFGGKTNTLAPSDAPMALPRSEREPAIRWDIDRL